MGLSELSASRANLPTFPGATVPEKLINGRNAAMAILRSYRPDLDFNAEDARQSYRSVDAWMERNSADLQAVLADPNASALPERVQAAFDKKTAQDFIVAGFTMAASGLGPWASGAVATKLSSDFARSDAETRLRVFASIVEMEKSGYLATLFNTQATSGLGALPVIAWVVIGTVLLAAIVLTYMYSCKQLELNNRVMRDLCEEAQKKGDQATVAACVEATRGLQDKDMFGIKSAVSGLFTLAVVGAGIYLAFAFGPKLLESFEKRKARQ